MTLYAREGLGEATSDKQSWWQNVYQLLSTSDEQHTRIVQGLSSLKQSGVNVSGLQAQTVSWQKQLAAFNDKLWEVFNSIPAVKAVVGAYNSAKSAVGLNELGFLPVAGVLAMNPASAAILALGVILSVGILAYLISQIPDALANAIDRDLARLKVAGANLEKCIANAQSLPTTAERQRAVDACQAGYKEAAKPTGWSTWLMYGAVAGVAGVLYMQQKGR